MADTTLTTTTKRPLDVAVRHGDGSADTALGDQFDVSGWDTTVLAITNESRQTMLVGLSVGTTAVHVSTKDGSVTGSFSVEVIEGVTDPPPAPDTLVFTFGALVAK